MKKVALLATLLLLTCLFSAGSLHASCIYSRAKHNVTVLFTCGWGCSNDWYVKPGEHRCRPGKGGTYKATYCDTEHFPFMECDVYDVDAHGWVSMHEEYLENKRHDGSLKKKVWCVD
ncbi:MAG: hypothetical protein K9K65_01970 [Desulfarculaceae bacterium]|nr:hypothetical protein [Desulfarculaceae bacterium]MCF8064405.1 hypothetical protein [Desulfarculaceae bacterium]MCF8096585.1 hypothetical protein [Desulfarculaceae bacterium]MCF8122243.1 hypothetical protein [Desulfarculaceae bacterium]